MNKMNLSVAIAAATVFAAFTFATAQQPVPGTNPPGHGQIHGRGAFQAQGKGTAELKGDGVFHVKGKGQLVIRAKDERAIKVEGFGLVRRDGDTILYEGRGTATVRGKDVMLRITGDVDKLTAGGQGAARLVGVGTYRTKAQRGDWSDRGIDVRFGR